MIEWSSNGYSTPGTLQARRILPALTKDAMANFRPQQHPLLREVPPLDARQSVILKALLRSSNNPTQLYQLSKAYSQVLLAPQTVEARTHDVETSLVELRALGTDHQTIIEMLLQANNALQQKHARESHQLGEVIRRLDEEARQRKEDIQRLERQARQRKQATQRLETRLRALKEVTHLLRSRVDELEDDFVIHSDSE
jgi:chromosome segregation ATPase